MKTIFAAMALLILSVSSSHSAATYVAGMDYQVLPQPFQTSASDRIEVRSFFWYGSSQSFKMNPVLNAWKNHQRDDVLLVPTPAVWNQLMTTQATAFYALQAIGASVRLNEALFTEIHINRNKLSSEQQLQTFLTLKGVSAPLFSKTYRSFDVKKKVHHAQSIAQTAAVSSLPSMVVAGKYRVDLPHGGNAREQLRIVDFLVEKERTTFLSRSNVFR